MLCYCYRFVCPRAGLRALEVEVPADDADCLAGVPRGAVLRVRGQILHDII